MQRTNSSSDSKIFILNYQSQLSQSIYDISSPDVTPSPIHMQLFKNTENSPVTRSHRIIEPFFEETNSSFLEKKNMSNRTEVEPIVGYAQEPLLPLSKACVPLFDIVKHISFYVQLALHRTPEHPPDGLTIDESAAIRLYTMEWEESESLYSMLNYTLRKRDRKQLIPYFKYMKLLMTAFLKVPCLPPMTVWRGVTSDISTDFPPAISVVWWSFLSCTTKLTALENNVYLDESDERTVFSIEAVNCRTIHGHSEYNTEDEVILLPGTQVIVQSPSMPASDLHVVHVKQILPEKLLLEPPFQGAMLYPKMKQAWYEQKRYMIPLCLLAMFFLAAMIVGSVLVIRLLRHENKDTRIVWNRNKWAEGCDFHGNHLFNVTGSRESCDAECYAHSLCTHFTWVNRNGGTCFLKQGKVAKTDAVRTSNPTVICGVEYVSGYNRVTGAVSWDDNSHSKACDFEGNSLSDVSSTAVDCSGICAETPLCTHYTWSKYNGGTCFMKQGNVSRPDALCTDDQQMECGIIASI